MTPISARTRHSERDLCAQIATVERLGNAGLNVTRPYKQAVIGCLDELAPIAALIGAVNTVQFVAGRRVGHNTDAAGFTASFRDGLPAARLGRVLQLGAGGAGAAVAQALLDLGAETLLICDREPACANDLVSKLNAACRMNRAEVALAPESSLATADGLVNATPMGMADDPRAPIDVSLLLPRQWVADIVYFPLETALLRAARARGCPTLDGSGMAVRQAAASFVSRRIAYVVGSRERLSYTLGKRFGVEGPSGLRIGTHHGRPERFFCGLLYRREGFRRSARQRVEAAVEGCARRAVLRRRHTVR